MRVWSKGQVCRALVATIGAQIAFHERIELQPLLARLDTRYQRFVSRGQGAVVQRDTNMTAAMDRGTNFTCTLVSSAKPGHQPVKLFLPLRNLRRRAENLAGHRDVSGTVIYLDLALAAGLGQLASV